VNNAELLLAWCEANPTCLTSRGALIDELMESRDWLREECEGKIRLAVMAFNTARNLAMAAALVAGDSPVRHYLLTCCRNHVSGTHFTVRRVYLIAGCDPPAVMHTPESDSGADAVVNVRVGADWLIELARGSLFKAADRRWVHRTTADYTPTRSIP
jgi:hypothetical protein